jgi:translation initiation factor IF-2
MAAQAGVPITASGIIYQLMDDIKQRVIALLPVSIEKRVTGEATVLQLFEIQLKAKQTMKVAGCRITNGLVEKDKTARVVRNGEVIFEGSSSSASYSIGA